MFFSRNWKKNFVWIKLRNLYATDKKYKSINVRNSRVWLFFNPDFSDNETVFLCEWEMDYFILKQLNFWNVIANMWGVSSFMEDWLALFENKDIYILYDRDTPWINWMMRVKEIIEKKIPGKYKSINYLDFWEQWEDINDIYLRLKREWLSDKEIWKKIFENMKLIPEK
jgi:DNA primase